MTTPPRLRCWLIGADSLLLECAEILLRAGHEVLGVVAPEGKIADWARSKSIARMDSGGDYFVELARAPFDYLFAITHLERVPENVLALPASGAINFHDGPLPDYSGLNTPVWALIQGEARYGITWHAMTAAIDGGAILKQKLFDVARDETALSLNAKCFEAALDSFGELIEDLASNRARPQAQDERRRRTFERSQRPPAACAIDWTRPARDIERLVRALDFGRYANAVGVPKIQRGGHVFAVVRARAIEIESVRARANETESVRARAIETAAGESASAARATSDRGSNGAAEVNGTNGTNGRGAHARPGTVLAIDEQSVLVATGRDAIALERFTDLSGRPLAPLELARALDLAPGRELDTPSPDAARALSQLDRTMSRNERFWTRRLAALDPVASPFARAERPDERKPRSDVDAAQRTITTAIEVPATLSQSFEGRPIGAVLTAAFVGWLARLARSRSFDVGYRDATLRSACKGLEAWIAPRVPLRVEVESKDDLAALDERLSRAIDEIHRRGPWLRDLIARQPELAALRELGATELFAVAIERVGALAESAQLDASREGAHWTLEIEEPSGDCRFVIDAARFSTDRVQTLRGGFEAYLSSLAARASLPLSAHDAASDADKKRQLVDWNDTSRAQRRDVCVHELFREQVARTPNAIAVACNGRELTYAELDARSDALARELVRRGVRRGQPVGISLERSPELVIAVLAVLKSGGAYLPLDPAFPRDRVAFMVEDAELDLIVTHSSLAGAQPATRATFVLVDAAVSATDDHAPTATEDAQPSDVAYVIYTSGSTGRPKGVLVEHRNVASFFEAMDERVPRSESSVHERVARSESAVHERVARSESSVHDRVARSESSVHERVPRSESSSHPPRASDVSRAARDAAAKLSADDARSRTSPGTWLAVTSLSFDISVLELLWTLTRGFKVVLHSGGRRTRGGVPASSRPIELSLFYFSSDASRERGDGYRLLLEGAKFADANGFRAVWTPERHFHDFGGLYPNPAVTGAAIAAITKRVEIRAGSVVMPLHHPIRVVEEWSLVDNLSGGRVAISFASGWHPNDFVLAPQNHKAAKEVMFRDIDVARRLWRGERLAFAGPDGRAVEIETRPRPVQRELPVWITSAGNIETYVQAGTIGANVLTHLLGQSIEELAEKIAAYRAARAAAGFDPASGIVTLMLHTFVGEDEARVRETVREPLERYLASSLSLLAQHAQSFPAFRRGKDDGRADGDVLAGLSSDERAALLAHARERYYRTSGLFGTPERCREIIERITDVGVDEIACLIDFGIPTDEVLASLPLLDRVRREVPRGAHESPPPEAALIDGSLAELIRAEGVTHLQCTPSMARVLCSDPSSREALRTVRHLFVGGEALPEALARELASVCGSVTNMYGPTETTIWSSTHPVDVRAARDARAANTAHAPSGAHAPGGARAPSGARSPSGGRSPSGARSSDGARASGAADFDAQPSTVPIGRPIANTRFYILDENLQVLPIGVAGELVIGGDGVARGYLRRPELDAQRFVPDPFAPEVGARMYRTGDLARYRGDGVVEFLGRTDQQIKVRGHRIEPGEIESVIAREAWIQEAVVVAREDIPGDQRLVAYLLPRTGSAPSEADEAALREKLKSELPAYMVPSQFVFVDRIPRTPNQKIDRRALPAPEQSSSRASTEPAPPASDLEARLAQLWQATLGVERVGVEDNFFDLGGHSLLAVRIHRRLGELTSKRVSLTDLFRFPTIRALARFLADGVDESGMDEAYHRGQRRRRAMQMQRQRSGEG